MKYIKLFEDFENVEFLEPVNKVSIYTYIDKEYPEEPEYYIDRLSEPTFAGEGMSNRKIESKIKYKPEGIYSLGAASGEVQITVKVDADGIIVGYAKGESPFDADGVNRFEQIVGIVKET